MGINIKYPAAPAFSKVFHTPATHKIKAARPSGKMKKYPMQSPNWFYAISRYHRRFHWPIARFCNLIFI
jgi:hypothetical protein